MQIEGKVAVVTGAAGGIGKAVAGELAKRGALHVAVVDKHPAIREVAAEINHTTGQNSATGFSGDVTDGLFREQVYQEMRRRFDDVTICVPAAGITRDDLAVRFDKEKNKVVMYPVENFRLVTDINLIAPVYWAMQMVAGVARKRRESGLGRWSPEEGIQGAVVFIGSVSSLGNKGQIAYSATKAGLEGAASTLTMEAIFHGVRCGVIHPGYTDTAMVHALSEKFIAENIIPRTRLRRLITLRKRRYHLFHDQQFRGERLVVG
jgi:NAD(P)-dependent dehydrogenase (short-subunit alcohol dehydrogenase family)